jgi:hypothetical protein
MIVSAGPREIVAPRYRECGTQDQRERRIDGYSKSWLGAGNPVRQQPAEHGGRRLLSVSRANRSRWAHSGCSSA